MEKARIEAFAAVLGLSLIVAASGCRSASHHHGGHAMPPAPHHKDIVDTAVSAGSFKTLVTAVESAGLVEALKGEGPFTVFAPTDAAFDKLPAGTLQSLLKPENRAKLQSILKYHVVPGKVMAADVVKVSSAKTLQGKALKVVVKDGGVKVDGANVV